jgi:hypothetical protein
MIAAAKGVDARDEREDDDREWSFRIATLPDSLYRTPMGLTRASTTFCFPWKRSPRPGTWMAGSSPAMTTEKGKRSA